MLTIVAESYLHRLDPFAIQFTETFGLRWYGLSYAIGFLIAWLVIRWMAKTGRSSLSVEAVGDLMFYVIAGVLVGGRVGYAIFYDPALFVGFRGSFPYWDLLAISRGGMASHGGMIGGICVCLMYARRHRVGALHLLDLVSFACPPGLALGRLANFVNGELWGRPLAAGGQADPPWWSIKYPEEITSWSRAVPEEAARLDQLEPLRPLVGGDATFIRNVFDAARAGREEVVSTIQPLLTAYYPSQILQAIAEGPVLLAILVFVWLRPRKPGIVGPWFFIAYGVLRILTEVFRQPDVGVRVVLGLSRGQLLSVLIIAVGVVALFICPRRDVPLIGGLRAGAGEPARP